MRAGRRTVLLRALVRSVSSLRATQWPIGFARPPAWTCARGPLLQNRNQRLRRRQTCNHAGAPFDQGLPLFAEDLTDFGDALHEEVVADGDAGPNSHKHLVLGHDPTGIHRQVAQDVFDFGRNSTTAPSRRSCCLFRSRVKLPTATVPAAVSAFVTTIPDAPTPRNSTGFGENSPMLKPISGHAW